MPEWDPVSWQAFDQLKQRLAAGEAAAVVEPLRQLRRQWAEPALAAVLADALAQLGRTEEGIAGLEADVEAGVANHWTHYSLSQHLAGLGRLTDASHALRRSHAVQGWTSSEACGYLFTQDDFTTQLATWRAWFDQQIPRVPLRILQIGSWQGASTLWLLDEIVATRGGEITWVGPWQDAREPGLLAPLGLTLEQLVEENLVRSGRADRVRRLAGDPVEQLSGLPPADFDCICLQPSSSSLWIQLAIQAHRMLAPGGFLILAGQPEGYAMPGGEYANPLDFFVSVFEDDYTAWQEGILYLLRGQHQGHPPVRAQPQAAAGEVRSDHLLAGITLQVLWETESLLLADRHQEALKLLARHLPAWMDEHRRVATARLVITLQLSSHGEWKQAEALHRAGVDNVDAHSYSPEDLAAQLSILRTESALLSEELSLALNQGSLAVFTSQAAAENQGDCHQRWQSLSRSQLGQDLWVLEKLAWKRDGFFVEFGATDGVLLSNSWLLEKYFGWNGICAEPNPKLFARLQQNRSCHISPACLYRSSGERMRFVLADAFGGLEGTGEDDRHGEKRNAYAAVGEVITVITTSLTDLLDQHGSPAVIDYLSIDTEGSELAILEALDWNRYQFRCITVEHNYTEQRKGIQKLLEAQGYQRREEQWDDWYSKDL
jgi:FkbM family methyltransferase